MRLFKKLKEKSAKIDSMSRQGLLELAIDLSDENNKFHCQKCKARLSFFKMIVKSKSVNIGEYYNIKCRCCKYVNKIKKEVMK